MGRALKSGIHETPDDVRIRLALPKLDGAILAPNYWPRQRWGERDRLFTEFCERHPRSDWPDYVEAWFEARQLARG